MATKASPIKKILTAINDIGKNLSKSGIYLIEYDECKLYSSSIKFNSETYNVSSVTLNEEYKEYLPLLGYAVDGKYLSRVLKGTGVEIEVNDYKITINSKVKVKDEKIDMVWETNCFDQHSIRSEMLKNVDKIERVLKTIKGKEHKSSYEYDVQQLKNDGKFIYNISNELDVALLKLTNKMINTLNKDTISVKSIVTAPVINTDHQIKRLHIVESVEKIGTVRSYYPFIDR